MKSKERQYLKIYYQIREEIIKRIYPYGSRLKSKRTIALDNAVSVITVQHAMELLIDEGYIEAREKSGYFVIYRESDFQGKPKEPANEKAKPRTLESTAGEGAFPYSIISKTVRKVLLEYNERLLIPSDAKGIMELRTEIASYLARNRGIIVSPEQIIVGSGAEYLYGLLAQLFMGETFAIEDPSYEKIEQVYSSLGTTLEKLRLDDDGIPGDILASSKAKVLHVTPFNSYPSGITIGITKKLEYIRWAKERNGYIIEDNYDSELTVKRKYEESTFSMSDSDNVIYMNTFSNTISSAIRTGYMILPKKLLDEYNRRLSFYSCTVPVIDQYVIYELIKSGDFERHINRVRRERRKEMQKQ